MAYQAPIRRSAGRFGGFGSIGDALRRQSDAASRRGDEDVSRAGVVPAIFSAGMIQGLQNWEAEKERQRAEEDRLRTIAIQDELASDRAHERLLADQLQVAQRSEAQAEALRGAPQSTIEAALGSAYATDPAEAQRAFAEGRIPEGSIESLDATPRYDSAQELLFSAPTPSQVLPGQSPEEVASEIGEGDKMAAQLGDWAPQLTPAEALPVQDVLDARLFAQDVPGIDRATGEPLDPIQAPITSQEQTDARAKMLAEYERRIKNADAVEAARLEYMLRAGLTAQEQKFRREENLQEQAFRREERQRDRESLERRSGASRAGGPSLAQGEANDLAKRIVDILATNGALDPSQEYGTLETLYANDPEARTKFETALGNAVKARTDEEFFDIVRATLGPDKAEFKTPNQFFVWLKERFPNREQEFQEKYNAIKTRLDGAMGYYRNPQVALPPAPAIAEDWGRFTNRARTKEDQVYESLMQDPSQITKEDQVYESLMQDPSQIRSRLASLDNYNQSVAPFKRILLTQSQMKTLSDIVEAGR
jgi:hypothetical protein